MVLDYTVLNGERFGCPFFCRLAILEELSISTDVSPDRTDDLLLERAACRSSLSVTLTCATTERVSRTHGGASDGTTAIVLSVEERSQGQLMTTLP